MIYQIIKLLFIIHFMFIIASCEVTVKGDSDLDNAPTISIISNKLEWGGVGYPGNIPTASISVNVEDFGASGTDQTNDDTAAVMDAINSISSGVIYFPPGKYILSSKIELTSGKILRGAGPSQTHLECTMDSGYGGCITLLGSRSSITTVVTGGVHKGSTLLTLQNISGYSVGDMIELRQNNDAVLMYTHPNDFWKEEGGDSWASDSVGQMLKISSISGSSITIDRPLNLNFKLSLNPYIRRGDTVKNVGVENLRISKTRSDGATFQVSWAEGCFIKNIESSYTSVAHVSLSSSRDCEIRDSYFHHSHDYGGGGHGYGVSIGGRATDNLVENNIFHTLRHSMILGTGATGNVYSYNYSYDLQEWGKCDICLHGFYSSKNLFEGNIVQFIAIGDYWGPAGPENTFIRNRVERKGIYINDYSHYQTILGNEVADNNTVYDPSSDPEVWTSEEPLVNIRFDAGFPGEQHILGTVIHGNSVKGVVSWSSSYDTSRTLFDSMYLDSKPSFFGALIWPPMGPDKTYNLGTIPAKLRHDNK